jgi:hypothetical protein
MPGFQAEACLVTNQTGYINVVKQSYESDRIEPTYLPCSKCDSGPCIKYGDDSSQCLRCRRICRPDSGGWCYHCDVDGVSCGWDPC